MVQSILFLSTVTRDSTPILPRCVYFGLGRPPPLPASAWNGCDATITRRWGFGPLGPRRDSDSPGLCACGPECPAELGCSSSVQLLCTGTPFCIVECYVSVRNRVIVYNSESNYSDCPNCNCQYPFLDGILRVSTSNQAFLWGCLAQEGC